MKGFFKKLGSALTKSSTKLSSGITDIVTKRKLDHDALEALEELLITSDLGLETSSHLVEQLSKKRFNKEVSDAEVKEVLSEGVNEILVKCEKPLNITANPHVIVMTGVNGVGKTTTIAKLAKKFKDEGKSVMLAAGDTFRAAAGEQLEVWAQRLGLDVYKKEAGSDAAALAFEAYAKAKEDGTDIILVDTAGRLHNKAGLMDELKKIIRVLKKHDESAPHHCLLVLDATTGQNTHAQLKAFQEMVDVNGLIITKLDGSAKGGSIVGLANEFEVPIYFLGVGEGFDDLQEFNAEAFSKALLSLV